MRQTTTSRRRLAGALTTSAALALVAGVTVAAPASADKPSKPGKVGHCARQSKIAVPGAEKQVVSCLDDLTTAGTTKTGHTDTTHWSGLHVAGTTNPTGVPGIQVDGYFPDTSKFNTTHGWNHDSQFVMRFPDDWNGKVVISGAPGVRGQYANDYIFSDWVLGQGYAFASTDKGNMGPEFFKDGVEPGDAIAEWHTRVTQLAEATKAVAKRVYAKKPNRTYMMGISNGGYLTRWQLENRPDLYDGGVDWEGTLFRADGPNLFTYLPTSLKNYPPYKATGDQAAHDAMIAAGFEPGSEFLWDFHYNYYWDFTQRTYREELDPTWDGDLQAGVPFCASGTPNCDADYDYSKRPQAQAAVKRVENTGAIGKPMITIHGTLDALLPIRTDSDVYDKLVDQAGASANHRYYRIEGGTHTDGLMALAPTTIRPLLPCARTSFDLLTSWVEKGVAPPADATYPRPTGGDLVNGCQL
ncbi:tannase/feruloyl esterase family alpha/beta hydrolase [Actinomycetota bacterium]